MKPVDFDELFRNKRSVDYDSYKDEIGQFVESGAKAAEVYADETKGVNCNLQRYYKAIYQMGLSAEIKAVIRKGKVYLVQSKACQA